MLIHALASIVDVDPFLQVGGMSLPVDEKLIKKIYELVDEGAHQVREMERHLKLFVKNELFNTF